MPTAYMLYNAIVAKTDNLAKKLAPVDIELLVSLPYNLTNTRNNHIPLRTLPKIVDIKYILYASEP